MKQSHQSADLKLGIREPRDRLNEVAKVNQGRVLVTRDLNSENVGKQAPAAHRLQVLQERNVGVAGLVDSKKAANMPAR
jgi:hypothetical protein